MIKKQRHKIQVQGIVQGVGFRPYIYRLAKRMGLNGFIRNDNEGVTIEVQGNADSLSLFKNQLQKGAPALSQILQIRTEEIPPNGDENFIILDSDKDSQVETLISPDIGICDDCLQELFDPSNRRYRYPFINCTNCGPRYTILHKIPYDRSNTSMQCFFMCPDCEHEYHDPNNRRFHAQPNACPVCGPNIFLYDNLGKIIETTDPVLTATRFLQEGKIMAVRGIGGFHLAVDAVNEDAVQKLRQRKGRSEKPFALMASAIEHVKQYCHVSEKEAQLLNQPSRPIVLLESLKRTTIASSVAPNQRYLGFMLPYTPLHHLLLHNHFDALVMTSGNFSEEPIAIGNDEAFERLQNLADYILFHNREILQRCDDSVTRVVNDKPILLRRSRGYVPSPIFLQTPVKRSVLACGGELKNTVALSKGEKVFLSQHIGDLDNPETLSFFENTIDLLQDILEIHPNVIAYDLHPEYLSTKWALNQKEVLTIGVQHHHAHLASVLAENGIENPAIGIILDGTGFGLDRTIWGGEVLIGDANTFERYAWLQPVPMPGGTAAIKQPWRMALAYLYAVYGEKARKLELPFLTELQNNDVRTIFKMIEQKINAPPSSGCGRLFDAVSAMLGIRSEINVEAQAAMELEVAVDQSTTEIYEDVLKNAACNDNISVSGLIQSIVNDLHAGETVGKIAAKFHRTLAEIFVRAAKNAREKYSLNTVGLSGGVFQNVFFFQYMKKRLEQESFQIATHSIVPTNDGGLALGQLVIADAYFKKIEKS